MGSAQKKASPDDKQEFLKDITKLLTILDKMGKRKPNGVDISKYMKAAADAVEKALAATSGSGNDSQSTAGDATGDAEGSGDTQTPPPADTGATGATS
jgi:hypothetical protein